MKKSKFLIYAALAAAATINVSCSDKDEVISPVKGAEGADLIVNASVDDTRATALTSTNLTAFKLYGFQNPATSSSDAAIGFLNGADGIDYEGAIGSAWGTTSVAKWPTTNKDRSCNFYALSAQGGSDLNGFDVSSIQTGTFSYTAPIRSEKDYVDPYDMKDLMIASSIEALESNSNAITLPFKHAFAQVSLQLRWNHQEYLPQATSYSLQKPNSAFTPNDLVNGAILAIDYIAFHNVYVGGDYSFKTDKWTVTGEKSVIKYEFTEPKVFYSKGSADGISDTDGNRFIVQNFFNSDSLIMMVPQTLDKWIYDSSAADYDESKKTIATTPGAYIEIHCIAYHSSGDKTTDTTKRYWEAMEWDDDLEENIPDGTYTLFFGGNDENKKFMKSWYFPLNKITSFEANKKYNIRLNMMSILDSNGDGLAGVTINF